MTNGKVFTSNEIVSPKANSLIDYPSLGHRIIEQLEGVNSEVIVFIDAASGRQWTGRQVRDKILNVACALVDEHGFKPGDVACISYDHSDHSCLLALGIIVAGGAVACAYPKDPYGKLTCTYANTISPSCTQ